MASLYTYDDFTKAYSDSGYYFSDADLALAKLNPDAGMGILSAKQKYANADTDEERALANAEAESIRSSYGNYTGGTDGSEYNLGNLTYSSFTADEAPAAVSDTTKELSDKLYNYGSFTSDLVEPTYTSTAGEKPTYSSYSTSGEQPTYSTSAVKPTYSGTYTGAVDSTLNNVLNYGDFSYDPTTDELYSAYRKQYAREGQRATADALAEAAAASGGIASSYATTAATQAGDYYSAQMTDKIPELYQIAYNKYLQDFALKESQLADAQSVEQQDYAKYLNELSQYNTDRDFDLSLYQTNLGQYNTNRNFDLSLYQTDLGQYNTERDYDLSMYQTALDQYNTNYSNAYQAWQDAYDIASNNVSVSSAQDAANLAQYNTDRTFNYGQLSDEVEQQTYLDYLKQQQANTDREFYAEQEQQDFENALDLANLGAEYYDYSKLAELGIDATKFEEDRSYQADLSYALSIYESTGDGTALAALGVNATKLDDDRKADLAIALGNYSGDYTYLYSLLGGTASTATATASTSTGTSSSSSKNSSSSSTTGSSSSAATASSGTSSTSSSSDTASTLASLKAYKEANYPTGSVSSVSEWQTLVATYGRSLLNQAGLYYRR
jgi:hypothetical protein